MAKLPPDGMSLDELRGGSRRFFELIRDNRVIRLFRYTEQIGVVVPPETWQSITAILDNVDPHDPRITIARLIRVVDRARNKT